MTRRPLVGALGVLVHEGRVLLVQRRNPPDAGLWGYPGGHVEWGETAMAAAVRELAEETGVRARALCTLDALDLMIGDDNGGIATHFVLIAVLCAYVGGTPQAGDDAADARWVPLADVRAGLLPMSARVAHLLDLAMARAGSGDLKPPRGTDA